jgi:formylglycine-generating enzyme required for sulfatase activity/serine/threonine protein kinase
MDNQSAPAEPTDARVQAALREYLERVDRGETLDSEKFIAERAEIAPELRSFIDAEEQLRRLAARDRSDESRDDSTQSFAARGQETIAPRAGGKRSAEGDTSGLKQEFGRYRIIKALGKGAMGMVYLAEDTQLQRQVALKTPHFEQEPTPELLERFYREARAAATLRHPNICPVYDVGQIEETHYISMAYIEGHPLTAFIRAPKPQPERQILIVVRKLAQALQEAHDHGIVHRDLKPANIMVDKRNEPIIMDFGLARQLQRETNIRITQSGMLIGTPAYMSPEQVDGEPDKVGPPSDQYSLGVILYELLTGQLPFRGSLTAVMAQIITKETPHPSQLRPDLDTRIEAACLKMMAKDPANRFATLSAVAEEFAAILRNPGAKQTSHKPSAPGAPVPSPPPDINVAASGLRQSQAKNSVAGARQSFSLAPKDLVSLEELTRKCLARHDYDQVIQIIERIPEQKRSAGLTAVLEKSRAKADEITFLICEIDEASRFHDRATALKKADELLKIKPGHHRALKAQEEFAGYGQGGAARLGPLRQFTQPWNEGGWIPWSVLAFGLAIFGGMTAIVVIYLNKTAIEVDIQDPDVVVEVKAKEMRIITGPKDESVVVEPGDQQLTITYAGLKTVTRSFSLKKGDKKKVTVSIANKEIVAKLDNEALALESPADREKATNQGPAAIGPGTTGQKTTAIAVTGAANSGRKTTAMAAVVQPPLLAAPFDHNQAATARQAWAQAQQMQAEMKNSAGMDLVLIPPGQFSMGSPETADELLKAFGSEAKTGYLDGERPAHRVTIGRPFFLGKYEVTVAQFRKFVEETSYRTELEKDWKGGTGHTAKNEFKPQTSFSWRDWGVVQTDTCPVVNVTYNDATEFCKWLSGKEGRQYRLPTEAEWEYACRAGSTTRFYNGDDPNALSKIANFGKLSAKDGRYTLPVGQFAPNNFDLYDMSGNVSEWCSDLWSAEYYARSPVTDPEGPEHGKDHVSRGGGWFNSAIFARSAHRRHFGFGRGNCNIGFRVACASISGLSTAASNEQVPLKDAALKNVGVKNVAVKNAPTATASPNRDDAGLLIAPFDEPTAKRAQQEWADRLKTPVDLKDTIGVRLRLIPPGRFRMGSDSAGEDKRPEHHVRITHPLYFGTYEVTKGEFGQFAAATQYKTEAERNKGGWRLDNSAKRAKWDGNHRYTWRHPGFEQANNHPVVDISWDDARAFCEWLSHKEGNTYRLPTEAEWEYVCRAGTTDRTYNGNDQEKLTEIANVADATAGKKFPAWPAVSSSDGWIYTSPVGQFRPNNFGLYDTIGNVSEWCADWYGKDYYKNSPENDPPGPTTGKVRIGRGGPFNGISDAISRGNYPPVHHGPTWGFRVVCEIPADRSALAAVASVSGPGNPVAGSAKNDKRRFWKGTYSSFEPTGENKWHETQFKPQPGSDFVEVARTRTFVELFDSRRNMHVRLTDKSAQWHIDGKNKGWSTFQDGRWEPRTASAASVPANLRAAAPEKK